MIYICIPMNNCADVAGLLLWKIRKVMAEFPRDYLVLVGDDASTDGTREILEPYRKVVPVEIVRHDRSVGHGAMLERLLREAVRHSEYPKRDIAITLSGDFVDDPSTIIDMIKRMEGGVDFVGSVWQVAPASLPTSLRWARRLHRFMLGGLRKRIPSGSGEVISGFRAYRIQALRKALEANRPLIASNDWAAQVELIAAVSPFLRRVSQVSTKPSLERVRGGDTLAPWPALKTVREVSRRWAATSAPAES